MTQKTFLLPPIETTANAELSAKLQHKIDNKTKPLGALGQLENLAQQLGLIQRSETLEFKEPQMVVFAKLSVHDLARCVYLSAMRRGFALRCS